MLHDHTHDTAMRLLVNQTRLATTRGPLLALAHRRVGFALAPSLAEGVQLEEVPIDHVAGPSTGVAIPDHAAPVILPLMRGGLFVAEGIWEAMPGASLHPWDGTAAGLHGVPLRDRPVIVVDSVIDRGTSMRHALDAISPHRPSRIAVAALVANDAGLQALTPDWPDVTWAIARVSARSYVGRGTTDTGARLFGTTSWTAHA